MPAPDLVRVLLLAPIIPVIDPAPLLVIDNALRLANLMAAALKVFVLTVNPVNGVVPPTAPVKVVLSVVVVDRVLAPLTVELNKIAPALLPVVKVVPAPKVTAPVYVCSPPVVTVPAKVLVVLTTKLEVPELLVIALVPLIAKELTVNALPCKSRVALVIVNKVAVLPKVPVLVNAKVPPVMEVGPA